MRSSRSWFHDHNAMDRRGLRAVHTNTWAVTIPVNTASIVTDGIAKCQPAVAGCESDEIYFRFDQIAAIGPWPCFAKRISWFPKVER